MSLQKRLVKYVFYSERSFVAFKVRGPSVVLLNRRCARIRFDVQHFLSVVMLGPVHASVEAKVDLGPGRKQTDDNNNNILYYYDDDMYVVIILIYYFLYYYFIEFVVVVVQWSAMECCNYQCRRLIACTTMGRREVVNRTQSLPSQA